MSDLTILIAHPDDEILFLWPFLQEATRIVCCVSDEHNPERAWCKDRKLALADVGRLLGIETICLDADSEFYRMPTRDESLKRFCGRVSELLTGEVATHNPWGEYGHLDHILCHHIARTCGRQVLVTDIAQEVNWLQIRSWLPADRSVRRATLDMSLYRIVKAIYDTHGSWTWSQEPVSEAGIYAL